MTTQRPLPPEAHHSIPLHLQGMWEDYGMLWEMTHPEQWEPASVQEARQIIERWVVDGTTT